MVDMTQVLQGFTAPAELSTLLQGINQDFAAASEKLMETMKGFREAARLPRVLGLLKQDEQDE